jgi:hypothetical protein
MNASCSPTHSTGRGSKGEVLLVLSACSRYGQPCFLPCVFVYGVLPRELSHGLESVKYMFWSNISKDEIMCLLSLSALMV